MNFAFKILGSGLLLLYLLLHYYVGLRSLQALRVFYAPLKSYIFWAIFLMIAVSYIANRTLGLSLPFLNSIGSYWIAAFFYLLLFYLFLDLLILLDSTFDIFPSSWEIGFQNKRIYSLALILTTAVLIFGSWNAYNPQIVKYNLNIAKKIGGIEDLKLVMISDLHIEGMTNTAYLETAAQTITSLNPDFILLAGDIVESTLDSATEEKLQRIIKNLKSKHGIYAVLGNHEYYGGHADKITAFLQAQGVTVLRDEFRETMEGKLYLVGRNDYRSGHFNPENRKNLDEILLGIDSSKPIILLDHQPQDVTEAKEAAIDLMLSGHTHGGQLFPVQLATKSLFLIDRGLYQENSFNLIVSTGLGLWGPPIRTSSRSEIVEINLTFRGY